MFHSRSSTLSWSLFVRQVQPAIIWVASYERSTNIPMPITDTFCSFGCYNRANGCRSSKLSNLFIPDLKNIIHSLHTIAQESVYNIHVWSVCHRCMNLPQFITRMITYLGSVIRYCIVLTSSSRLSCVPSVCDGNVIMIRPSLSHPPMWKQYQRCK